MLHVKNWSFCLKRCSINRREPHIKGAGAPLPCGGGGSDLQEICPSTMCYDQEFVHFRSNGRSVFREIPLKNYSSHPAFQGHSRSSEPSSIDRRPMTFLLTFHSNHRPIYSEIFLTGISVQNCKSFLSVYFLPPLRGFLSAFRKCLGSKN